MPPTKKKATKSSPESKSSSNKTSKNDPALAYVAALEKEGLLGDVKKKIDFISTGSWIVNRLIGDGTHTDSPGGFPRGYIVEVYGDEGCGKTTLALHAAKQVQLAGGRVIYADFEHSLRTQYKYIENLGVDMNPPNFIHLQPNSFEEGASRIGHGLIKVKPALIVIDSVTAMLPQSTFDADADHETQIGKHAKLTGNFLNWMNKRLDKANCCLLLLNQLRSVIKTSKYDAGPNEITSGGKAPRFYSSVRLKLAATSKKEEVTSTSNLTGISEKKRVSQIVKATVEKNKLDIPFKSGPIYITFGQGIDNIMSLINYGVNRKIIKKSGAFFEWKDPNGNHDFKVQGVIKLKMFLEQNPDTLDALKPYLVPTQDEQTKQEIKEDLEARGWDRLDDEEKKTLTSLREELDGIPNDDDIDSSDLEDLDSLKEMTEGLKKIGGVGEEKEESE